MAKRNRRKKPRRAPEIGKKVRRVQTQVARLPHRYHEVFGVIFLLAATMVLLSLASFDPADPIFDGLEFRSANRVGLVGAYLAHGLLYVLGVMAFLLIVGLAYASLAAFTRGGVRVTWSKVLGYLALTVQGAALGHIALAGEPLLGHAPGGVLGEYTGGLFVSFLSATGSVVVLCAGLILALIATTGFSLVRTVGVLGSGLIVGAEAVFTGVRWCSKRCAQMLRAAVRAIGAWFAEQVRDFADAMRAHSRWNEERSLGSEPMLEPAFISGPPPGEADASALAATAAGAGPAARAWNVLQPPVTSPPPANRREPVVVTTDPPTDPEPNETPPAGAIERVSELDRQVEPEIVIPRPQEREIEDPPAPAVDEAMPLRSVGYENFALPSLDMLESEEQEEAIIDKQVLHDCARRLEQKLLDYGIKGQVTKIMPGPVVTMYEYAPGPGIKVAKITNLAQDLALVLEAFSVRIIAPIPGRAVVGIEVSNKNHQMVYAKEIIGHKAFVRSRSKLTVALGKNIEGAPYVTDLNKMPHLLVAGATGTGKSVALNCMITSILYKSTPEDVRFIMVDPKVLELSLYEGIPHLLLPVVIDPRKAQAALQWAVSEMDRRIQVLHAAGVRNLDAYNRKAEKQAAALAQDGRQAPGEGVGAAGRGRKRRIVVLDKTAETPEQELVEVEVAADSEEVCEDVPRLDKMPHIVIVIDELADLMMTAGREVETNIARIAQKARAAGIHLIVATQRPSVNVITGLIKANLPARISFRVASKVDSRTILDTNGAEALLGSGDMLFHPPTSSQLVRVHGAFISEEEITKVVEHLKAEAEPVYDESILAAAEEDPSEDEGGEELYRDELYDLAVQIVAEMGQASTSMVQRKLRIGYNRAARLIERMEREGIVGPPDGARPRRVLIQNHTS